MVNHKILKCLWTKFAKNVKLHL